MGVGDRCAKLSFSHHGQICKGWKKRSILVKFGMRKWDSGEINHDINDEINDELGTGTGILFCVGTHLKYLQFVIP